MATLDAELDSAVMAAENVVAANASVGTVQASSPMRSGPVVQATIRIGISQAMAMMLTG